MPIPVIVNGATGKMGILASEILEQHPDFDLVAKLSKKDDLSAVIASSGAEIVVDLTRADMVYKNTLAIVESGAHPVIGTSGLTEEQILSLTEYCEREKLGGIIVPNFSIAAILMMRFAAETAVYLKQVEIVEMHHPQKFDAPSGTAIKTAEMIAKAQKNAKASEEESLPTARGEQHQGIPIHSLRLPGVLAKQQVIFGSTGETLTIEHNTMDRACFMPGLVLCCQKVRELKTLYYGLEQLL